MQRTAYLVKKTHLLSGDVVYGIYLEPSPTLVNSENIIQESLDQEIAPTYSLAVDKLMKKYSYIPILIIIMLLNLAVIVELNKIIKQRS